MSVMTFAAMTVAAYLAHRATLPEAQRAYFEQHAPAEVDGLPGKVHGQVAVWLQGALFAARVPLLMSD